MSGKDMDGLARRLEEADRLDGQAARTVGLRIMMDWVLLAAKAYALGVGEVRVALPCANPDTPERTRLMVAAVLRNVAEGLLDLQETQAKDRDSATRAPSCWPPATGWACPTPPSPTGGDRPGKAGHETAPRGIMGNVRVQDMRASHLYNFNGVQAMPTGSGSKATGTGQSITLATRRAWPQHALSQGSRRAMRTGTPS